MLMPNGAAGQVSIEFGARAGAHALASACASSAEAIGYGIDMIRAGRADVVIAGGTEAAIHALNLAAVASMHGTSTPIGDVGEIKAIKKAFGDAAGQIVVTSTKSMTGHLLGGTGAVESIATLLALRDGLVPPTINIDDLDDEVDLDIAQGEPR